MKKIFSYFFFIFLFIPIHFWGQVINAPQLTTGSPQDSANISSNNPNSIQLINSDYGTFYLTGGNTINVVIGNVIFEHKGERLYADSARLNVTNNTLNAYKNVKITKQDGTVCYANEMFYNGNTDIVELKGNVQIVSNMDNLWSEKIIYNMKTNIGYYDVGGVLQTGPTIISSRYAQYNGNTYDARFKGNVNVEDPDYLIISSDMNFNTDSRIAHFYGPSIIRSDSTILYTTDGYYDTYNEVAQFHKRSSIFAQKQYIEADTMDYNKRTGLGIGRGNVVLLDSLRKINIYGQLATLNEITGQALVTKDPFAVMYESTDTTWVLSDTFFTEPIKNLKLYVSIPQNMSAQDSLLYTLDILKRSLTDEDISATDSITPDISELINSINADTTQLDYTPDMETIIDSNLIDAVRGYIDTTAMQKDSMAWEQTLNTNDTIDTILDNSDSIIQKMDGMIFTRYSDSIQRTYDSNSLSIDSVMSSHSELQETVLTDHISHNDSLEQEEPRYLIAYRNVFIYNDSFQAKSDSLRYSQEDTLLIFYKNPVLWTRDQQVIGDIIEAFVDSNQIRYVHIPRNGILIAQSTEKNEVMFDQVQANDIWAYFGNNEIDSVIGTGNAQTIYYAADEQNRYVGVSEASSMHLKMIFEPDSLNDKRRLSDIIYYTDHEQTMTPMSQANMPELRLSRFRWRKSEKIPTKEDFFQLLKSRQYPSNLRDNIVDSIQEDKKTKE